MARKKKKSGLILKGTYDFTLLITVFILLGLGIVTVLSASSPTALNETGDNSYKYVMQQIKAAAIGIFLMFVLSKVDYITTTRSMYFRCIFRRSNKMAKSWLYIFPTIRISKSRSNNILCSMAYKK